MPIAIDHLVIGAATLEEGVAYVQEQLSVAIPVGGVHGSMGTHNHLMQLGNSVFLEVIAIDPNGARPMRPRWYGLDDPYVQRQLAVSPSLLSWVINTTDIDRALSGASVDLGNAFPVSRGGLNWLFGLPDDGRLPGAGMLPYLIEWHTKSHPALDMPDCGCTLQSLEIYHSIPAWLSAALQSASALDLVTVHSLDGATAPYLEANIQTPNGLRTLRSIS